MGYLCVNFLVTGVLLMLFNSFGWISIGNHLQVSESNTVNAFATAILAGAIFNIALYILAKIYVLIVLGTLGLGLLLLPVWIVAAGPLALWVITQVLPGWITFNVGFLETVLIGIAICLIRWHAFSIKVNKK